MLNALAPLTSILEADSEKVSYDEVIDVTMATVAINWQCQCQNFLLQVTKGPFSGQQGTHAHCGERL